MYGDYHRQKKTEEYFNAISFNMGIPISGLYKKIKGGRQDLQGTCVHFLVALHLAHWLSTEVQRL
jgi:hypothetical protein